MKIYLCAQYETSGSYPNHTKIYCEKESTNACGMKTAVITNLPRFRWTPQSRYSPAPHDYDASVSYAPFIPIRTEKHTTLNHDIPKPTPANDAELSNLPAK